MNWTNDQQKVIDLRNRNILVSAAAGSGKTAVLVERIISMISDEDNPVDIDHLLIVTFTNAAAAEMRERIGQAIDRKLEEDPENMHLQKQMMLIHNAQITTIHSFCLFVISNYFNTIHIDPSFRVANEAELVLLKSDVIEGLLEDYYEEGDEKFLHFVECFASGKTDSGVEDIILKLYEFSMSFPWPEDWLDEKKRVFDLNSVAEMEQTDWMTYLKLYLERVMEDVDNKYKELISLCQEADGPEAYLEAVLSDIEYLDDLKGARTYEEYYRGFKNFEFKRLSGKRQEGVTQEKKDLAKDIRNGNKGLIKDIKDQYFFQAPEEMVKDIKAMQSAMEVLVDVTIDFTEAYTKKKTEKNLVDFNDLEHLCLNILVKKQDDKLDYTLVADELAVFYEEILIDEYQDSNLVQETILNSISKERYGKPNRFMVGDVKQSIYKFRLARPEIFMGKYEEYKSDDQVESEEDNPEHQLNTEETETKKELKYQRIDLHQNFRSREIVLDTVNSIFEQIMTKKIGNITYDDKAALYPGADFGEETDSVSKTTEILLVSPSQVSQEQSSNISGIDIEDLDEKELEAKAIANKIKELVNEKDGLDILDKESKKYRKAEYKDIVILLRTMSNWADVFVDVLSSEGIPCYAQTQRGYFNTLEIKTILNTLKIIDNPRQDIPFTAVLKSPVVGLNSNELARIRMSDRNSSIYEASCAYRDQFIKKDKTEIIETTETIEIVEKAESTDSLAGKLDKFIIHLEEFRAMVPFLTISELILKVLDMSGYYDFVSAMPAGEKRKANIDMLVQKAIQFEETSYSGLFHFVRYIEKLHKYDVDFGEADAISGSDNSVRIMSIHKSKGLEFPLVFVSGLGKNFNQQDARDKIIIHPDLGLGPDFIDPKERIKSPTLPKKVIQKNIILENLGEELRVLYVAMTRAKEKLILTGCVKNIEKQFPAWQGICKQRTKELSFSSISSSKSFLDLIIPAILRFDSLQVTDHGKPYELESNVIIPSSANIKLKIIDYNELAVREMVEQTQKEIAKDELINWDTSKVYNEDIRRDLQDLMNFTYPYGEETKTHAKLTVTELKRLSQIEEEDTGFEIKEIRKQKDDSRIPNFIETEGPVKGAGLGTLYHKLLDNKSLLEITSRPDLKKYLNNLHKASNLSEDELKSINIHKLLGFLNSDIAGRMREASSKNKLYTEQQFIMGLKASEINGKMKSDELVLIQGIIDVYFEENGKLVLLDYKTDKVDLESGEEVLRNRYLVQLDYYEKALEQLTDKQVSERIIYSFALGKEIIL